ncbi:hypothetical protein E4665_00230 [Sporolactobacillus shoreae]|uniref:DUF1453 family protein n=1 Tax=Sporolactobacillus shoreae TaxID=1465501 RepID=A0A4Z0GT07_9BACL|nr:hypothetical protein [Sporolactobacillus shoreae]TGB00140.1 hypothetical protein E4665_00230 [Sporolactobacillus shoreae]
MLVLAGTLIIFTVFLNQLREKPLTGRLYRQPVALLLYAACALSFMASVTPADWCMIVVSLTLSFALGMIQGRFTPLVNHDGAWYVSGSAMAVLVWFLSIPIRYLMRILFVDWLSLASSLNDSSSFIIYFIFIAGLLLGRYSMLFFRYPSLVGQIGRNEQRLKRQQAH